MIDNKIHTEENFANKSKLHYMLIIAIIISIFSQLSDFQSILRPMMFACWVILWLFTIRGGKIYLSKETKYYAVFYAVFVFYCMICSFIKPQYLHNNYMTSMLIPLGAMYIGANCAIDDGVKIDSVIKVYIWIAVLYALYVNIRYFPNMGGWLSSKQYIFASKNSAAQIWCSAAILALFFYILNGSKKERVLYSVAFSYLLFVGFISGCRTAVLGLIIAVSIYFVFFCKSKLAIIILVAAFFFVLMDNSTLQLYLEHFLQTDKFSIKDFNSITSGRGDNWQNGLNAFFQSMLIGNGNYYCDCSYISVLAESGLIGFFLIESIWIRRIIINFARTERTPMKLAIVVLTVFYIIESSFEGLPPFGPGVSAFMFWLMSGYYNE